MIIPRLNDELFDPDLPRPSLRDCESFFDSVSLVMFAASASEWIWPGCPIPADVENPLSGLRW